MPGIPYPSGLPAVETATAVERDRGVDRVEFESGFVRQWEIYDDETPNVEEWKLSFLIPGELLNSWFQFINAYAYSDAGIVLLGQDLKFTADPIGSWVSGNIYRATVTAVTVT